MSSKEPLRPYFSSKTDELRKLFEENKTDKKLLKALKAELRHRDRPKAKKLAALVEEALLGKLPPEQMKLPNATPKNPKKRIIAEPLHLPIQQEGQKTQDNASQSEDLPELQKRWLKRYTEIIS